MAIEWIRNPVGVLALGSDRVGGRPYLVTIINVLAYWVLTRADLSPFHAIRLPFYLTIGTYLDVVMSSITYKFPSTFPILSKFYTGITGATFEAEGSGTAASSRLEFLGGAGLTTITALCSYFQPLTIINPLYFFRFALAFGSFLLILYSGFRNLFFAAAVIMVLGSYYRKKITDILSMAFVLVPVLTLVILMNGVAFNLPIPVQRALSFLPGRWDYNAKADADGSTEWRVYMWKAMLSDNRYLSNRWIGDGFGYSRAELLAMVRPDAEGGAQESFLITGQVHSGPLSAVKYVGVVGFILFMALLVASGITASRIIRRSFGTPFFPAALFIGIPLIFLVVSYVFIFGGYDGDLPKSVIFVGMLKLLTRGLADYKA